MEPALDVDGALLVRDPLEAGPRARALEALGYAGAFTFEGPHDPFLPLLAAAADTRRIRLATAIAVGFARSPMLLANLGYDLQLAARGRFVLGLGSQVRAHVERRFGMPWSRPAARMRELVLAVRAIWAAWHEGVPLDFRGEHYVHTLMTPIFDPGPHPFGLPPIHVAGVGPRMTEVAGEVGDGLLVHPFHTDAFLRETTLPALARGRERAAAARPFEIVCQVLVASGPTPEALAAAKAAVRAQIAFYASTPAYRGVLEAEGLGDLQRRLQALSRAGGWADMAALVPDALLHAVAAVGDEDAVAERIRARCAPLGARVALVAPYAPDAAAWGGIVRALANA